MNSEVESLNVQRELRGEFQESSGRNSEVEFLSIH